MKSTQANITVLWGILHCEGKARHYPEGPLLTEERVRGMRCRTQSRWRLEARWREEGWWSRKTRGRKSSPTPRWAVLQEDAPPAGSWLCHQGRQKLCECSKFCLKGIRQQCWRIQERCSWMDTHTVLENRNMSWVNEWVYWLNMREYPSETPRWAA